MLHKTASSFSHFISKLKTQLDGHLTCEGQLSWLGLGKRVTEWVRQAKREENKGENSVEWKHTENRWNKYFFLLSSLNETETTFWGRWINEQETSFFFSFYFNSLYRPTNWTSLRSIVARIVACFLLQYTTFLCCHEFPINFDIHRLFSLSLVPPLNERAKICFYSQFFCCQ